MQTPFRHLLLLIPIVALSACQPGAFPECGSQDWIDLVEAEVQVIDDQGHGPDPGGDEWMRAVSSKLGVIDDEGHGPDIGSAEWCAAVEAKISNR